MEEMKLYQKKCASCQVLSAWNKENLAGVKPEKLIVAMLFDICSVSMERPDVFHGNGSHMITILFHNVSFASNDFWYQYGEIMAEISGSMGVTLYGTVFEKEIGEMTVERSGKDITIRKYSPSGRDYDTWSGLCMKIECGDSENAGALADIIRAVSPWQNCGAVKRDKEAYCRSQELAEQVEGACYLYIPFQDHAEVEDYVNCLSMEQKAQLWKIFLEDQICPKEFEWLYSMYQRGEPAMLQEWELALQSVLEELSYRVVNENNSFLVTDGVGDRKIYDFNEKNPGVKVFLKILFPIGKN